ncbi:MAG: glycosyltransferase [Siphonobacter sp.]
MNFVIISRQPWEEKNMGSNIRDMAKTLAMDHQVLFINQPLDWTVKFRKNQRLEERNNFIKENNGKQLIEVEKNLWVLSPASILGSFNWINDGFIYDFFNKWNGKCLANDIIKALKSLKWNNYVILNDNDMIQGFYLKEILNPSIYIYYIRDNFLAVDYWKRHGQRLEPLLMQKADIVVSNSLYYNNIALKYNTNSTYIGQGCLLELFDGNYIVPDDVAKIPHPRIGYTGTITTLRLDVLLIEAIAIAHPDWQIILIGATEDSFPTKKLSTYTNIIFLGSRPIHTIPDYLYAMDVLINPQVFNEVTIGNYPRKIDEYLAIGKPIVAINTETMSLFKEHVFLANNNTEFITYIEKALNGENLSSVSEKIVFAQEHNWENSMSLLVKSIKNFLLK